MNAGEAMDDYQLCFDRVTKTYATRNRKYIIRVPLGDALKKEELSDSELATVKFVLRTGNPTMFFLEELRILERPFDATTFVELQDFCSRPWIIEDESYKNRRKFLAAFAAKLEKETKARRKAKVQSGRFQTMEGVMGDKKAAKG
ncbi:MAG: hypothetical protein Q9218_006086 [Villophora microphyllina]